MVDLKNSENMLAELYLKTKEINSSLVILQQAVQNENAPVTITDIDNHLELISEKFPNITNLIEQITQMHIDYLNEKQNV